MEETVVERKYHKYHNECTARRCMALQEYEAVGVSAARKLQRMDYQQAVLAESLINDVLKCGLLKLLTERTEIYEKMFAEKGTETDPYEESVCDPDCEGKSSNEDERITAPVLTPGSEYFQYDINKGINEFGDSETNVVLEATESYAETNQEATNMDTLVESNLETMPNDEDNSKSSSVADITTDYSDDTSSAPPVTETTNSNRLPEGGVLSAQLSGNRIVNLQYIFNAFNILINHSTSPDCRNNMTFGHESMNGLVSTISFPCSGCRQVYYLDTQPQDSNINVRWMNCSAALGIESCKLSSIFKYFDIPISDNDMTDEWKANLNNK